ncbi:MAG: glutathione S-transferase family protein [Hyphomicrobiales bacterium]
MSKLTLISHKLCPFVQRAAISLAEKGIEFVRKDIDLGNKPDWFLKISPLGKVPLLIVSEDGKDDVVIFESNVILEYLEDTTEPKLHPTDALERARHRSWNEFGSTLLGTMWALYSQSDEKAVETAKADVTAKLTILEGELAKNTSGDFFGGEKFSTVDTVYAPMFRYLDMLENEIELDLIGDLPKVKKWKNALRVKASVKAVVPSDFPQLLKEFMIKFDGVIGKQLAA